MVPPDAVTDAVPLGGVQPVAVEDVDKRMAEGSVRDTAAAILHPPASVSVTV